MDNQSGEIVPVASIRNILTTPTDETTESTLNRVFKNLTRKKSIFLSREQKFKEQFSHELGRKCIEQSGDETLPAKAKFLLSHQHVLDDLRSESKRILADKNISSNITDLLRVVEFTQLEYVGLLEAQEDTSICAQEKSYQVRKTNCVPIVFCLRLSQRLIITPTHFRPDQNSQSFEEI